jgi:hypothetical protein
VTASRSQWTGGCVRRPATGVAIAYLHKTSCRPSSKLNTSSHVAGAGVRTRRTFGLAAPCATEQKVVAQQLEIRRPATRFHSSTRGSSAGAIISPGRQTASELSVGRRLAGQRWRSCASIAIRSACASGATGSLRDGTRQPMNPFDGNIWCYRVGPSRARAAFASIVNRVPGAPPAHSASSFLAASVPASSSAATARA